MKIMKKLWAAVGQLETNSATHEGLLQRAAEDKDLQDLKKEVTDLKKRLDAVLDYLGIEVKVQVIPAVPFVPAKPEEKKTVVAKKVVA